MKDLPDFSSVNIARPVTWDILALVLLGLSFFGTWHISADEGPNTLEVFIIMAAMLAATTSWWKAIVGLNPSQLALARLGLVAPLILRFVFDAFAGVMSEDYLSDGSLFSGSTSAIVGAAFILFAIRGVAKPLVIKIISSSLIACLVLEVIGLIITINKLSVFESAGINIGKLLIPIVAFLVLPIALSLLGAIKQNSLLMSIGVGHLVFSVVAALPGIPGGDLQQHLSSSWSLLSGVRGSYIGLFGIALMLHPAILNAVRAKGGDRAATRTLLRGVSIVGVVYSAVLLLAVVLMLNNETTKGSPSGTVIFAVLYTLVTAVCFFLILGIFNKGTTSRPNPAQFIVKVGLIAAAAALLAWPVITMSNTDVKTETMNELLDGNSENQEKLQSLYIKASQNTAIKVMTPFSSFIALELLLVGFAARLKDHVND